MDQQVKVRGFRIEPGEIETALELHGGVERAVVTAREDGATGKRLVAYIVGVGKAPAPSELREWLRARLPEYMVPSMFVTLDALPLTPNGKVDRKALPAPEEVRSEPETAFEAPRTPIEQKISEIWADVLGVERIGLNDNFFDLGGHSLRIMQVMSRLQKAFHVELHPRCLFVAPTVSALAVMVGESEVKPAEVEPADEEEELARLLAEIEGYSDEDVELLLADEMRGDAGGGSPASS